MTDVVISSVTRVRLPTDLVLSISYEQKILAFSKGHLVEGGDPVAFIDLTDFKPGDVEDFGEQTSEVIQKMIARNEDMEVIPLVNLGRTELTEALFGGMPYAGVALLHSNEKLFEDADIEDGPARAISIEEVNYIPVSRDLMIEHEGMPHAWLTLVSVTTDA